MSRANELATRMAETHGFQTPVGAFISSKVWQKEARYKAFFSWMDSFFQQPFSFSRRAFNKKESLLLRVPFEC